MQIVKKAYAKINLSIDVLAKRSDAYHELDMLIQSVSLYDIVRIEKNTSGKIYLDSNDKSLPMDIKNDAFKAAYLMKKAFSLDSGYNIYIDKKIPIEAGLGGGSSDAAAVINAIVSLENLRVEDEKLFDIGLKIGAELPYSIISGLSRVKGIGESVERLDLKHNYYFTIVKPKLSLSTKDVFTRYQVKNKTILYTEKLYSALKNENYIDALKYMHNDLETVSFNLCNELASIQSEFMELGALQSLMSGSGPSMYGVFEHYDLALKAEGYFKDKGLRAFAVKAIY